MKEILRRVIGISFIRNVLVIVTGTAAAQVVTIVFSPLITRIYGPEIFGIVGVFMAMVGIISPVAALSYPISIVLPRSDKNAEGLIIVSLIVSVVVAIISTIIVVLFDKQIVQLLQISVIAPYIYLIPCIILFSAVLQILEQWLIRNKQFKVTAKITFLQSIILNITKVGFGYISPVASVLVILSTLGTAIHAILLFLGSGSSRALRKFKKIKISNLKNIGKLAIDYKDFPLFRAPQVFLNTISLSLPILLLSSFFGPSTAGFYSIGKSVLGMPVQLIGKSFGDVFYPRFSDAVRKGENLSLIILKATLGLAIIAIIPFSLIFCYGPSIFEFVFGDKWETAGEYARWLALWSFFVLINRPCMTAIPVLRLQGQLLIYEIISIFSRVAALLVGFYYFRSDIHAVICFSLISAVLNISLIYYTFWKCKSLSN